MKKIYFSLMVAALASASAVAQNAPAAGKLERQVKHQPLDKFSRPGQTFGNGQTGVTPDMAPATSGPDLQLQRASYGTMIGYTYNDHQSYGGYMTLLSRRGNTMLATWMHSRQGTVTPSGTLYTPFGRSAAYNYFNGSAWKFSQTGILTDSLRTQVAYQATTRPNVTGLVTGTNGDAGRIGWPSAFLQNNGAGVIVNYTASPTGSAIGTVLGATINPNIATQDTFNRNVRDLNREAVFQASAGNGVNLYVVSSVTSANVNTISPLPYTPDIFDPLVVYRSTDNGVTWTTHLLPGQLRANGFTHSKTSNFAIDVNGSTVAVVATYGNTVPRTGMSTVLFKSTDNGNTWTNRVVDFVPFSNPARAVAITTLQNAIFVGINDGAYCVHVDKTGRVHYAVGYGFSNADTSTIGNLSGNFYMNGALDPEESNIKYWNESFPANSAPQVIARPVDQNRNGARDLPASDQPSTAGDNIFSYTSYPAIVEDTTGAGGQRFIITYSSVLEEATLGADSRVSRDNFVVVSSDGGTNWSDPINLEAINGADDGSGGSSGREDNYPTPIRRMGDGILRWMWMSDNQVGSQFAEGANTPTNRTAGALRFLISRWHPSVWNYHEMNVANLFNYYIGTTLPTSICRGTTITLPYTAPAGATYAAGNRFIVELDTTGERFNPTATSPNAVLSVGAVASTTSGTISVTVPASVAVGSYYMRIRATSATTAIVDNDQDTLGRFSSERVVAITQGVPAALNAINTPGRTRTDTLCGGATFTVQTTNPANTVGANISEYVFEITPAAAGSVLFDNIYSDGNGNFVARAEATINSTYNGSFTITVKGRNGCGDGPVTTTANSFTAVASTTPVVSFDPLTRQVTVTGGTGPVRVTVGGVAQPQYNGLRSFSIPANQGGQIGVRVGACIASPISVTSIKGGALASQVSLFPNPASTKVKVDLGNLTAANATYVIYNSVGAKVASGSLSNSTELNISSLAAGLYTVKVSTAEGTASKQLVKE